jgi:hypothetical protein
MFRTPRPRRPRFAAPLTVSVLLASAMAVGAPAVQATSGVVDLETTALRLSGSPISAGGTVAAGVTLTPVHLTTADPESAARDSFTLSVGRPEVRVGRPRVVFPAVPAEQATFRIDGATVATSVPSFVFVNLQTDQGQVNAALFTVGGVTYAIPRAGSPSAGATRTVASSRVGTTSGDLATTQYGLLPVGAQLRTGPWFRTLAYGSTVVTTSVGTSPVYDADNIRGNSDSLGEELPTFDPQYEVLATVTLRNGAAVAVRALRIANAGPYGELSTSWAFDRSALAAAGATIADVTSVVSFAAFDHDLTWAQLGFDLV